MDVLKLDAGSPLLGGDGFLSLDRAADVIGLTAPELAAEAANQGEDLYVFADGWQCAVVPDILQFERDYDGSIVLNEALADGEPQRLRQHLLWPDSHALAAELAETGTASECRFYFDSNRRRAAFVDMPGVRVAARQILLHKAAAGRIGDALRARLTPQMVEAAARNAAATPIAAPPGHKYAAMRASELVAIFVKEKTEAGRWKADQQQKMRTVTETFLSLMDDPTLGKLDRPAMDRYRDQLRRLPKNVPLFRRKHGSHLTFQEVADLAESMGLSDRTKESIDRNVGYLSEMLAWAVHSGYMPENPARTVAAKRSKGRQDKNQRDAFSPEDLGRIFGADWYKTGRGKLTSEGTFRTFRPHYYWLPLLGLYTGARINELSQLYLADIRQTGAGVWYLDFNLDGADKLPTDDDEAASDKSLKTVNSQRSVPLHSTVLNLGFVEYCRALRAAGCKRLFPELLHDKLRGYGKPATQWFGRFLGNQLKIDRNGRKVFHSFRHTFITGLFAADIPDATVSQLSGHAQEGSEAAIRYRKDQSADQLKPYVERLAFDPPDIAPFDVAAGVEALKDALAAKRDPGPAAGVEDS